jgi:hypothetical protein
MKRFFYLGLIGCLLLAGCSMAASEGKIGKTEHRRVVVLGEYAGDALAKKYANQYSAVVFYSPDRGALSGATLKALTATLGPSSFMRRLMNEFRSMGNTSGEWEVIIPARTERYFLVTLRNMEDGAVANADGKIILPESSENTEIEKEVARVFGSSFSVMYQEPF